MNNIIELFDKTVARYPSKTAIISEAGEFSYNALDLRVKRFSSNLWRCWGVTPGDRVAMLLPNCPEFVSLYLGILRCGAIPLPVNVRLKAPEIRFIVRDAGARALIVHRKTWNKAQAVLPELPDVKQVMSVDFEQDGLTAADTFASSSDPELHAHEPHTDDVAVIIYTSGTTGAPKGAMLTHANLLFNTARAVERLGYQRHERYLVTAPLFHVTGMNAMMLPSLMLGGTMVLSDRTFPWDIVNLIARHRVSTYLSAPATFIMLCELEALETMDLSSVRAFIYGGAPMPSETVQRLNELMPGIALYNSYGLTETTSLTTVLPSEDAIDKPDSVGTATAGVKLKVVDAHESELPPGETGELWVKGESVFKGYFNNPQATRDALVNGWFRTGDLARIDRDGYVFLKGRKTDLIIVGGENVYPMEVENVISNVPGVLESVAVGQDHPVMGQMVKAFVVPKRRAEVSERMIKAHCEKNLASYKVPNSIEFLDRLPRNPSGKVIRRLLK